VCHLPKTKTQATPRVTLRVPKSMADEVDRIVEKHGFYGNRQRFIETAIQEKIEKVRLTETVKHDAR